MSMRLQLRLDPRYAALLLSGMVQANVQQILDAGDQGKFRVLKGLHQGTIRYIRLDDAEDWKDYYRVVRDGGGDCEDLAPAVAAEYMAAGIGATPVSYTPTPSTWHVITRVWPWGVQKPYRDGDPSVLGGMGAVRPPGLGEGLIWSAR